MFNFYLYATALFIYQTINETFEKYFQFLLFHLILYVFLHTNRSVFKNEPNKRNYYRRSIQAIFKS